MDGWKEGWVGGWMDGKAGLRIVTAIKNGITAILNENGYYWTQIRPKHLQ